MEGSGRFWHGVVSIGMLGYVLAGLARRCLFWHGALCLSMVGLAVVRCGSQGMSRQCQSSLVMVRQVWADGERPGEFRRVLSRYGLAGEVSRVELRWGKLSLGSSGEVWHVMSGNGYVGSVEARCGEASVW